ncbi:NAD(P)-binding protein [Aaosphaeria arxii CBS 175.79]|uniref:Short-chain dehydrogenase/reductase 3 n=1 Tax=Aaosphaeria arxii CBS 175.79 TaxID=1450172 RepID=A0A6A5XWM7_9PLEO|nr:NAD(P)-binding protein [Aaosphaeria arxii CBS 175.79]KAF2017745.1 NAD(P)-binding protein [Aaosphaeria arxii CBS 175.79]
MAAVVQPLVRAIGIASNGALNPVLSGSALAFITYGPPHLVSKITDLDFIRRWVDIVGLKTVLKILLTIGVGKFLNRFQNRRATNGWKFFGSGKWDWPQEIAVVTGGCNGIGKAIVLGLVRKGIRVAILDVADQDPELQRIGTVSYWKCDICSPSAVAEAADSIRKTIGHPTILINNAGIANSSPIIHLSSEKLSKIFGVNLLSLWYTAREFLPNMILKDKGHIVTIASMASYISLTTAVDYSASKAGALAFYEGLSSELKHIYKAPGVMNTVAHPMWVETNMTKSHQESIERSNGGRMMKPEDVANVVVNQILSRRGAQLIIPPTFSWLSGVRGFPNWFQEMIRDGIGKSV